jgi:hypothetical protein
MGSVAVLNKDIYPASVEEQQVKSIIHEMLNPLCQCRGWTIITASHYLRNLHNPAWFLHVSRDCPTFALLNLDNIMQRVDAKTKG